jgi:carbonic anhydrase
MSVTDDLLRNNERYAASFDRTGLAAAPSKRVVVLACMDARLIPTRALGLNEGEAHILRNAGGVVTDDAIRSISISQTLLGTEEVILLHHTDCGMQKFTDDEYLARMESEAGARPTWSPAAFSDLEADLREGMRRLRESPFIPRKDSIRGFVYDVETGRLTEIS